MNTEKYKLKDRFQLAALAGISLLPTALIYGTAEAKSTLISAAIAGTAYIAGSHYFSKFVAMLPITKNTARKHFTNAAKASDSLQNIVQDFSRHTGGNSHLSLFVADIEGCKIGAARHATGLYIGPDFVKYLKSEELEIVVVHEASHDRTNDNGLSTAFTTMQYSSLAAFTLAAFNQMASNFEGTAVVYDVGLAALGALTYGCHKVINGYVSRLQEYRADRNALQFTGDLANCKNALSATTLLMNVDYDETPESQAGLQLLMDAARNGELTMTTNRSIWQNLTASHPNIAQRITYLESISSP